MSAVALYTGTSDGGGVRSPGSGQPAIGVSGLDVVVGASVVDVPVVVSGALEDAAGAALGESLVQLTSASAPRITSHRRTPRW